MSGDRGAENDIPAGADSAQASVEWTGLVLLVAVVVTVLAQLGPMDSATRLAQGLNRALLCAVSLGGDCGSEPGLEDAYGLEVAGLVRRHLPQVILGRDLLGMPVDYRTCRSPACADPPPSALLADSTAGEQPTVFTRVVDCRTGTPDSSVRCDGIRRGNLYLQYWAYYPESASLRGVPILGRRGYHPHDWEATHVRIGADGRISQRASSHRGFNHTRSVANWPSDAGIPAPRGLTRMLGRSDARGWGPWSGGWRVAGGSHAGNVASPGIPGPGERILARRRTRLVPLESVHRDALSRPARFDPITPPWEKQVWRDPEAAGTG